MTPAITIITIENQKCSLPDFAAFSASVIDLPFDDAP